MKIYFLGTVGYYPTKKEQTCCYLIEYKNHLIMLDAGTGVSNLRYYESILKKYDEVHIILSHYHHDHICGLFYLNHFFNNKTIYIYGPGDPFYLSSQIILSNYTNQDFSSTSIKDMGDKCHILDYNLNGFNIDDINIQVNLQKHTNHSFGIKIDDKIHYATDTIADKNTFNIALSTDILLHECWSIKKTKDKHSSLEEILLLNNILKMNKIYLIHKNPNWTYKDYANINFYLKNKNIFLAEDGIEIKIE